LLTKERDTVPTEKRKMGSRLRFASVVEESIHPSVNGDDLERKPLLQTRRLSEEDTDWAHGED
jgi:hypothetical protein